jgi:23S rRNA (cytosine1962-C5)-methyltransferase
MDKIILKPGREYSLDRLHPWVFSGSIEDIKGDPLIGSTVKLFSNTGRYLATASYSPRSKISARVWTWKENELIEKGFFQRRLENALALRKNIQLSSITNAYRLVHGESDGLPGLIVDLYDKFLVVQYLTAGIEYWRDLLNEIILDTISVRGLYERSDVDVRELEGLPLRCGLLWGEDPPPKILIHEGELKYWVDIRSGHKTGFYIDQRMNRIKIAEIAQDRNVLDCFCYTGGFSLSACLGGAKSVSAIDSSGEVLECARNNMILNNFQMEKFNWIEADVFKYLRYLRDCNQSFDMIVLDPPKFAPTNKQVQKAARGYKDINLLAFKLLRPGGILVTFSCSGGVSVELFRKIITSAAFDAGVQASILEHLYQGPDHPIRLNFPEGEYLKGYVLHIH